MNWILYVLSPVLVQLILTEGTAVLTGDRIDSAACTALSAFLTLLALGWMYHRDTAKDGHPRQISFFLRSACKQHDARAREKTDVRIFGGFVVCFLGGGLLNLAYSSLLAWLRITSDFSNQAQEALLGSQIVTQILGPGFLVSIAEELTYRGLFYTRIKTRLSVGQAVFFSALLFALLHGNPVQMIYAFPMALLLALIYEKSGSLIDPILFHMGANLAAILLS